MTLQDKLTGCAIAATYLAVVHQGASQFFRFHGLLSPQS
ncbi:TPA: hypothetical protein N0F65_007605 [Lagenidium giganteum]|uniref:Uncharacterized protein n=1 Tax=Lagenidium giganteum TaxID=4803 RepID=A0AAV2ZDA4_9STRA|nr:TPA: hypothetical protein N0F65_007605 [Lagenidium giganteum]